MDNVKYYIKLYQTYTSQFLKSIIQSKVDTFLGLIGFFVVQFTGVYFLYLVFDKVPSIEGWTFAQLLFIYGFAQIPRGIDHFFTDNLWILAWNQVVNGDFDRYMLRPVNLLFQVISERLQPDALGELTVGIVLLITSISKGVFHFTVIKGLAFLISIIAGTIIYTSIKLMYASLAFWFKISGTFLYTAYQTADFAKYPITIYSKIIRFIISWVVPFAFVAFYPASYLLDKEGFAGTIGVEIIIAIVFACIACFVFKKGTKRYESAGN